MGRNHRLGYILLFGFGFKETVAAFIGDDVCKRAFGTLANPFVDGAPLVQKKQANRFLFRALSVDDAVVPGPVAIEVLPFFKFRDVGVAFVAFCLLFDSGGHFADKFVLDLSRRTEKISLETWCYSCYKRHFISMGLVSCDCRDEESLWQVDNLTLLKDKTT